MPLWLRRALVIGVPILVVLGVIIVPRLGDAPPPGNDTPSPPSQTTPGEEPTQPDAPVVPDPGTGDAPDFTPRSDDGDPQEVIPDPPAGENAEQQSRPMPGSAEVLGEVRGPTPPANAVSVRGGRVTVTPGTGFVRLAGRDNPRQARGTVAEGGVGAGAGALVIDAPLRLRGPGLAELFVGETTIDVATGKVWASFHDGQMYPYLSIPAAAIRRASGRVRINRAPVRLTAEGRDNLSYWNARSGTFTGIVGYLTLDAPVQGS